MCILGSFIDYILRETTYLLKEYVLSSKKQKFKRMNESRSLQFEDQNICDRNPLKL